MNEGTQEAPAGTAVVQVTTAIEAYTPLAASIATMLEKHKGVVHDVTTTKGMEAAKADRRELRTLRVNIEATRKKEKEASLEYGRKVDAEAKRLIGLVSPLEDAYDAQIAAEEERKEAERRAKLEAEQNRVHAHRKNIEAIKMFATKALGCDSAAVAGHITTLQGMKPGPSYEEFQGEAEIAWGATLEYLQELQQKLKAQEDVAAQLKAEREALEAEKRATAEREAAAEREREAERKRQREEEERRQAAEREKLEAERKAQEEERQKLAKQREAQEAEERRQAEQKRLLDEEEERQRQEAARIEREAREAREAQERQERERQEREAREQREREEAAERERQRAAQRAAIVASYQRQTPVQVLDLIGTILRDGTDALSTVYHVGLALEANAGMLP